MLERYFTFTNISIFTGSIHLKVLMPVVSEGVHEVSSVNLGKGLSWKLEAIFITTIVPRTWELDSAVYCSFLALCGNNRTGRPLSEICCLLGRAGTFYFFLIPIPSSIYAKVMNQMRGHMRCCWWWSLCELAVNMSASKVHAGPFFFRLVLLWSQDRHPGMGCQFLGLHFTILRITHNFMHFAKHAVRA